MPDQTKSICGSPNTKHYLYLHKGKSLCTDNGKVPRNKMLSEKKKKFNSTHSFLNAYTYLEAKIFVRIYSTHPSGDLWGFLISTCASTNLEESYSRIFRTGFDL